jgi:hypothetical protein
MERSHSSWIVSIISEQDRSGGADLDDSGTEFFYFFEAEAVNRFELSESLWTSQDDVAKGCRGEDEEEGEAKSLGFGLAPVAETFVESLLLGREGVGRVGCRGALAMEGFAWVNGCCDAGKVRGSLYACSTALGVQTR